jgi:hypothetical protein
MATTRTSTIFADEKTAARVIPITAATTLDDNASSGVFTLGLATGVAINLPAPIAGFKARFIVKAAFATTAYTIVAPTAVIYGGVIVNSVNVPAAAKQTISLSASAETIGDWVEVVSDGTNYYVSGVGTAAASITFP